MLGTFCFDRQTLSGVHALYQDAIMLPDKDYYVGQVDNENKPHGAGI